MNDLTVAETDTGRRSSFVYGLRQLVRTFNANKSSWIGLVLLVVILLCAVFAPLLAPYDPLQQRILATLQGPSAAHWMGTDEFGRDILSRLLYGARVSLFIGFVSTIVALAIGGLIGVVAGYFGRRLDIVVMQFMDVLLAFPALILGMLTVAMLGPSVTNLIIAIALTAAPSFARIARSPTLTIKQREFIMSGRVLSFSDKRLIGRHILPNIVPEVLVMATLWLGTAIRTESSLAFIGLGVQPPTATWGGMIRSGFENILESPWLVFWPSMAILLTVFALNLLGDGLRDAIDPKLRGGT